MNAVLVSPSQAASRIAEAFERESHCGVYVQEQRAFKENKWLCLGTVSLPPKLSNALAGEDGQRDIMSATASFVWRLPDAEKVKAELSSLLDVKKNEDDYVKVSRALDQMASIIARTGLLHPRFDPAAIEEMPFRRATTVVSDTSGVLQGGLDFVVRHLHPSVRVKIPAIVQMEIVNFTDRFFKVRRRNKARTQKKNGKVHRVDELVEHMISQGGQRALLRLELQADAEIERTYLLGDPLRDAFQQDRDRALSDLNISVPVPAYADRLILEAARHHQAQSEPGHAVRLLTSDQGLARMALAEGMMPLYFTAVKHADFFGEHFTGQTFHPFTGDMHSIPLTQVLWELATAFGAARLQWEHGSTIMLSALNDGMPWLPFHSIDDLLWFSANEPANGAAPTTRSDAPVTKEKEEAAVAHHNISNVSFQQMNIDRLFRLICALDDRQVLDTAEASGVLNIRIRSAGEYRRFLLSAGLIEIDGERWNALAPLRLLSAGLRNGNVTALCEALLQAPSFAAFHAQVGQSPVGKVVEMSKLARGATTYRTLGELALICASVGGDVYATPERPSLDFFVEIVLRRFKDLDHGNGLVAAGRWLESLIQHDGIHPEFARRSLERANEEGLLHRSTEGSTMQTGFDNHVVHVLRTNADGLPVAMPVHLYRGDYLIPGKASVSLRIEEQP